jgi:ABC-type transporter Mla subunit MlaD
MNIQERIEQRLKNAQRIAQELNEVNQKIQALTEQRQQLIEEAIGNNEALKELRELKQQEA